MKTFLLFLPFFFLFSCFGHVDKRGSVTGYKNGVVSTEGGRFQVGGLPPEWVRKKFRYRAILFAHKSIGASIAVDSFCKGSFDDARLEILANQLFYGITDRRRLFQKEIMLDERAALRTAVEGKLDGAPVVLDVVILKMNECVFDFSLASRPDGYRSAVPDFESLFGGFRYLAGPKID